MKKIELFGTKVGFFGKLKGANSNKFNRAIKLATMYDELDTKLVGFIQRGNNSLTAQLALATRLLIHTGIRVGNEDSAEGYTTKPHPNSKVEAKFVQTYGVTTLLVEHLRVRQNGQVLLNFLGKRQIENSFVLYDDLAEQIGNLLKVKQKGEKMFDITAYELTKFIKTYVGKQFSPKDFRTTKANIEAWNYLQILRSEELPKTKRQFNSEVRDILSHVSNCLNNTAGVCKKSYIDDMLFEYHKVIRMRP